jgi:hypothetical protein
MPNSVLFLVLYIPCMCARSVSTQATFDSFLASLSSSADLLPPISGPGAGAGFPATRPEDRSTSPLFANIDFHRLSISVLLEPYVQSISIVPSKKRRVARKVGDPDTVSRGCWGCSWSFRRAALDHVLPFADISSVMLSWLPIEGNALQWILLFLRNGMMDPCSSAAGRCGRET